VTAFYISPSCLSYRQYIKLIYEVSSFGWTAPWIWPRYCFQSDAYIDKQVITGAFTGIASSNIFIALVPGTASTNIEIGTAYIKCDHLFLVARDPVHFTQTGICDAHLGLLPGIHRVCCETGEILTMLRQAYVETGLPGPG
jgi:hypothetical protein